VIFNDVLMFVHVPKTGGMSLTQVFLDVLPRPVFYSLPNAANATVPEGVHALEGRRHESLAEAAEIAAGYGRGIADFRAIIGVIRNPYELEVSRYAYLQKGHPWDAGHNQELAMTDTFENFAVNSVDHGRHGLETYFQIDGVTPSNFRILRLENLHSELQAVFAECGLSTELPKIPRANSSRHDHYSNYYTPRAEKAVYERYRWLFDNGHYERFSGAGSARPDGSSGHRVPLIGPVEQVGSSTGLYADGWVGRQLQFSVRTTSAVRRMTLSGQLPAAAGKALEAQISVGDRTKRFKVIPGKPVVLRMDLEAGQESRLDVQLTVADTWSPSDKGREDTRSLSLRLTDVRFSEDNDLP
jgi:hypothetical protein